MSKDQRDAINTVKAYLKAMVWGQDGIWHMHLKDLEQVGTHMNRCFKDHKAYHVSAYCNTSQRDGTAVYNGTCYCNGQLGRLGDSTNGFKIESSFSGHLNANVSTHGLIYSHANTSHKWNGSAIDAASDFNDGIVALDHQTQTTNSDGSGTTFTTASWEKKDVDYASVASQAQWAIDDRLFVARGNGSEMVCADSMHIKIENLRELRKVAELTYRRMHICHSEKAQEFWLAGADPVGSGTYKNLFGASGPSGSETTGGRTNPGFCQQYSQYRSASVTEDKLLSDDTKALNEVILHSFPNCARTSGILKMTGSSTLRGHAINRHKADAALLRAFTTQAPFACGMCLWLASRGCLALMEPVGENTKTITRQVTSQCTAA